MRLLTHIVLHHSATDATLGMSDPEGAALWAAIQRNHQRHWAGTVPGYVCDYHFGVGPTGVVLTGQPLAMVAFNCGNARINAVSVAVCFLGNFQLERMPAAQYTAGLDLLRALLTKHDIPLSRVILHREVPDERTGIPGFTACPGRWFPSVAMRNALQQHGGGSSSRACMTR
ncbi:MAG TPA: peptidoglycan recognition family protein [Clostridia bacterium]|nr:peptidoglycan recognition family protein [Clostridia bacterium]